MLNSKSHHKFLLVLDGKLFLAPIGRDIQVSNLFHVIHSTCKSLTLPHQRVLDVGTGTGIWAIDFADEFPDTTVYGTDLSPIQPELVPPNCIFEVDDAQDLWTYPVDYFDFIHLRSLFGSISDWPALYRQAYKLVSHPRRIRSHTCPNVQL